jgi:copper chaperone CopZ
MQTVTYIVPDISCGHCVHTVEMELGDLEGVSRVEASEDTKKVVIDFQDPANEQQLIDLLQEINYPVKAD